MPSASRTQASYSHRAVLQGGSSQLGDCGTGRGPSAQRTGNGPVISRSVIPIHPRSSQVSTLGSSLLGSFWIWLLPQAVAEQWLQVTQGGQQTWFSWKQQTQLGKEVCRFVKHLGEFSLIFWIVSNAHFTSCVSCTTYKNTSKSLKDRLWTHLEVHPSNWYAPKIFNGEKASKQQQLNTLSWLLLSESKPDMGLAPDTPLLCHCFTQGMKLIKWCLKVDSALETPDPLWRHGQE